MPAVEVAGQARLRVVVRGVVQGVGFRPFLCGLAKELDLSGWVQNASQGVCLEVEGNERALNEFLARISREKPPRSSIASLESAVLVCSGCVGFEARASASGTNSTVVPPDVAVCRDCVGEVFDPANRRYLYPFTNCIHCGPRFSIIRAMPYGRESTAMTHFAMCDECEAEYRDPADRRFYAEPNACPRCGPHLELWNPRGETLSTHHQALLAAASAVRAGKVVAVKGLGGFHLLVDAGNPEAIRTLRKRKHREEKPFALMYPSLEHVRADVEICQIEERLLLSPEAPIVLLRSRSHTTAAAPGNPYLGVMLPYTPMHHLLMAELRLPVVATSGNLADEPICIDEHEALERLGGIADAFLVHDRPILRQMDDSIVHVVAGRVQLLRRSRGYAPLPVDIERTGCVIAVGGQQKNTVAIGTPAGVVLSQHIGDLDTAQAVEAFELFVGSLRELYGALPTAIASDLHPGYRSTRFALESELPTIAVQHHYAHILSCMGDNGIAAPLLGVAWDGTGYGADGTIWGGEFLRITETAFERLTHLRTFRLPGGDKAIREPRRAAVGMLYEVFGRDLFEMAELFPVGEFNSTERRILQTMLQAGINSPVTSSAGRLFDAFAALIGLRQRSGFEGQAAMDLEFALDGIETDEAYAFSLISLSIDWEPMVRAVITDMMNDAPVGIISARIHNTLVEMIVAGARLAAEEGVALSGGCFQNRYLTERTVTRLTQEGFRPYIHQRVPPNDGGIALGQFMAVERAKGAE